MKRYAAAGVAMVTVGLWSRSAGAQFPDLAELRAEYMPGVVIDARHGTRAQVAAYDGALNVPIPLGKKTFLIPGLQYHVDSVSYSHAPPGFARLGGFHSVSVPFLFVQMLPRDWSLAVRLAPGLAGDFRKVDARMLNVSAMALATHAFSDRFVLGGGVLASYGFGTFLPLPALYLEWKPVDGVQIETFLPAFLTLKYTFLGRIEIGLQADVAGNSYAVRDPRITDAFPCANGPSATNGGAERAARPAECLDYLAYSSVTAGGLVGVRLFGSVWATGFVGRSVFRRFDPRSVEATPVSDGAQSLPNTLTVRAGLVWRIPRD